MSIYITKQAAYRHYAVHQYFCLDDSNAKSLHLCMLYIATLRLSDTVSPLAFLDNWRWSGNSASEDCRLEEVWDRLGELVFQELLCWDREDLYDIC